MTRIPFLVQLTAVIVIGAIAGGASAWLLADRPPPFAERANIGPWEARLGIAAANVDPWTRAYIARDGLLALTDDRVVYFWAWTDSDGRWLEARDSYRIDGAVTGEAGWWSVTAYGADGFLMPDTAGRFSVNSVVSSVGGTAIDAVLGPVAPDGVDWIATTGDQRVVLLFRFYDHPGWNIDDIAQLPMPVIRRETAS